MHCVDVCVVNRGYIADDLATVVRSVVLMTKVGFYFWINEGSNFNRLSLIAIRNLLIIWVNNKSVLVIRKGRAKQKGQRVKSGFWNLEKNRCVM